MTAGGSQPVTVAEVALTVTIGGGFQTEQVAAAFDPIRTAEAARAAGRAIGDAVAECLARRLRAQQVLS